MSMGNKGFFRIFKIPYVPFNGTYGYQGYELTYSNMCVRII